VPLVRQNQTGPNGVPLQLSVGPCARVRRL
jgi:hypothetical protein